MPITEKQRIYLRILSYLTNELYDIVLFVGTNLTPLSRENINTLSAHLE